MCDILCVCVCVGGGYSDWMSPTSPRLSRQSNMTCLACRRRTAVAYGSTPSMVYLSTVYATCWLYQSMCCMCVCGWVFREGILATLSYSGVLQPIRFRAKKLGYLKPLPGCVCVCLCVLCVFCGAPALFCRDCVSGCEPRTGLVASPSSPTHRRPSRARRWRQTDRVF